ncbi:HAD family hydrolase [Kiloniella sp. b19]|uniref:HAD family hydrolase n=1 Tax=Kiloniella sp. GXU_MW_B19 TaxID=3141326 RepID=UPI0031E3D4D6
MTFPELIVFDCDGVLVDSESLSEKAIQQLLAETGAFPQGVRTDHFVGRTDREILETLFGELGREVPEGLHERLLEITRDLFDQELTTLDGVEDFIRQCDTKICVASNSNRERLNAALKAAGLDRFFPSEARFSSSDVERPKPAPDLHLLACRVMECEPDRALVIEDSKTGATAAGAAGISVLGLVAASHLGPDASANLRDAGCFAVAKSWKEVSELLQEFESFA